MTRALFILGLLVTVSACANRPPLLEQDGQYQPPRAERRARTEVPPGEVPSPTEVQQAYKEKKNARRFPFSRRSKTTQTELPAALTRPRESGVLTPVGEVAALPRRYESSKPPPAKRRFPELAPFRAVEPSNGRPAAGFVSGDPYPVAAQIVGEAAPEALGATVSPTIRRAPPVMARHAPNALNKPFNQSTLHATPSSRAAPAASAVDPAMNLQRAAAAKVVAQINEYRARYGFQPLAYSPVLSAIAQGHVADLADRGQVSALSREGFTIGVRLLNSGYVPRAAGSVVAGGYPSFDAAFENWTKNKVEASRLLMPDATEIGFAVITDPGSTYRTYIEAIIAAQ